MYSIRTRLAVGFALVMGITLALLLVGVHRGAARVMEADAVAALRTEVALHRARWQWQRDGLQRTAMLGAAAAGKAWQAGEGQEGVRRALGDMDIDIILLAQPGHMVALRGRLPTPADMRLLRTGLDDHAQGGIARIGGAPTLIAAAPFPDPAGTIAAPGTAPSLLLLDRAPIDIGGTADLPAAAIVPVHDLDRRLLDEDQPLLAGGALSRAVPLHGFGDGPEMALLIRHRLDAAQATFRKMENALTLIGLGSLLAALLAGWYPARDLTRPIVQLRDLAARVAQGDPGQLWVTSRDEIGDLATSFNLMVVAISEREARIAHLYRLACQDAMTGLPNRAALHEALTRRLLADDAPGASTGLFTIDIDDFRRVNDRLGHGAGDRLIRLFAERAASILDGAVLLARTGGDEFAAIVDGDWVDLRRVAQSLIAAAARPFDLDGHSVQLGASIGIAMVGVDGDHPDRLLHHAEIALHAAKSGGKGRCRFYREGPHMAGEGRLPDLRVVRV